MPLWDLWRRRSTANVWFAIPEAVIVHKLRFFRDGGGERHLRDIRGMLAVGGVDYALLEGAVKDLGLEAQWSLARTGGS